MNYFNQKLSQKEVLANIGNIKQIAGAQKMVIDEGKGKGTSVIRVRNGKGLDFTLVPDRGLDIFDAYYKGIPLAWISNNGLVNNSQYNDKDLGWLRSFGGGLLVTCGLRNVGSPCITKNEHFGLHGRFSSLSAENINIKQFWLNENYFIEVSARICETNVFGENLACYRTISVSTLNNQIKIDDLIINEGFRPEALALLYHFNWGSPLLSKDTELIINPSHTSVRDNNAPTNSWNEFSQPIPDIKEIVYLHEFAKNTKQASNYTLHNKAMGFGLQVEWSSLELPFLTQWKMMGQGEYVLGLEPGNCFPNGREQELKNQRMEILDSFEEKNITLNITLSDL